ncbi:MAG: hypothetical protein ACREGF_05945, partial [Candidatus Saccharimonadales bacterium]
MRGQTLKTKLASVALIMSFIVIALLPFHAFLSVLGSSLIGHYTLLRLWKEFLVLIAGLIVIGLGLFDSKLRIRLIKSRLFWAILAYVVLDLAVGFWAFADHRVSSKALAYGLLDDSRFLVFFLIVWAVSLKLPPSNRHWSRLVLWPAVIVIAFGLLEMSVLPANFLTHFGYRASTILPYATINNNPNYVRIISTLRGADPLGAYLILPISLLAVLLIKNKKSWLWAKALLMVGAVATLYASYSRAAWIGAVLAVLFSAAVLIKKGFIIKYKL